MQDLEGEARKAAEEEVKQWIIESLGGRVLYIMSGTAPTAPEVLNFFRDVVGVAVLDLYGSTVSYRVKDAGAKHLINHVRLMDQRFCCCDHAV